MARLSINKSIAEMPMPHLNAMRAMPHSAAPLHGAARSRGRAAELPPRAQALLCSVLALVAWMCARVCEEASESHPSSIITVCVLCVVCVSPRTGDAPRRREARIPPTHTGRVRDTLKWPVIL